MDGHRFDRWTRALATAASRRAAVKGAVAAAAAFVGIQRTSGGPALAQQNVPLGGRCSALGANAECSQAGTPSGGVGVVCSDNAVARDGSANCCRNAGGVCAEDFHCCGSTFCTNGICGGSSSSSGRALGSSCTSTSECSQTGGSVVCADNGVAGDGAKNCCRNQGGACRGDLECCAGVLCINGTCGGSGTSSSSGLAPGAQCTATSQCSQAGGQTVCGNNGYDTDGALNCCRNEGGACTDTVYSADCCGGFYCREGRCEQITSDGLNALGVRCTASDQCSQDGGPVTCADNGVADDGALNCCRYGGGACQSDGQCCAGLLCINGACGGSAASSGGSVGLGAACTAADECSQAGGAVACADNGIAADGALNCCRYAGGACSSGAGCCAGLECVGGVCGGTATGDGASSASGSVGLGGACSADDQCSQEGGAVACRDNGLPGDGERNCCRYSGGACFGDSGCCAGLLCIAGVCTA